MSWFPEKKLTGKIMEDIVTIMLQESDYMVLPYGYEQTHPALCQKWDSGMKPSITLDRLRNSPDLLVYDKLYGIARLVEVKSHISKNKNYWISKKDLDNYHKFWDDCILVEIIPEDEIFYAEYVAKLASNGTVEKGSSVSIRKKFRTFKEVFNEYL